MPSDHLPFAVATNVDFCESPIVTCVSTLRLTNSLQPTGDDGGVRIHANTKLGCFITLKLNSSRSHDREGFRLIQDLHVSQSYNQSSAHKRSMASASPRRYASFQTFSSCSISFMSSGFVAFERKGQNNPKTIPDAQIKLLIRLVNFCIRHSLLRLIIVSINPKSGVNF